MFAIVAVPFDAFRALPSPGHRWLLTCLTRYADRGGKCWPNMRQLAEDARMSLSTVQRRLKEMADLGVFHRVRQGVGRYVYTLAEAYRPGWKPRVSGVEHRVPQRETQKSKPNKQVEEAQHDEGFKWRSRVRQWREFGRWVAHWGPTPDQPGCVALLLADVAPVALGQ